MFLSDDATFPGKPQRAGKQQRDAGFVATAGEKGVVRVWDLTTYKDVTQEEISSASLLRLMYAVDCRRMLATSCRYCRFV